MWYDSFMMEPGKKIELAVTKLVHGMYDDAIAAEVLERALFELNAALFEAGPGIQACFVNHYNGVQRLAIFVSAGVVPHRMPSIVTHTADVIVLESFVPHAPQRIDVYKNRIGRDGFYESLASFCAENVVIFSMTASVNNAANP